MWRTHPEIPILTGLAGCLRQQASYAEAEARIREGLAIRRKAKRKNQPEIAKTLENLGLILTDQERHAEAEAPYREALDTLAGVQRGLGHTKEADASANRAKAIRDKGTRK